MIPNCSILRTLGNSHKNIDLSAIFGHLSNPNCCQGMKPFNLLPEFPFCAGIYLLQCWSVMSISACAPLQFLFIYLFIYFGFDFFRHRVSLCSAGHPGTHFVGQVGHELRSACLCLPECWNYRVVPPLPSTPLQF